MSATQPLCLLFEIDQRLFSKTELRLLEMDLFVRLCDGLKERLREQNKEYFRIMKLSAERENVMLDAGFVRSIINEILLTEEYDLSGMALYANSPLDVIYDLACGYNTSPGLFLSRRIIELHRSVRPEIYRELAIKILEKWSAAA